MKIVSFLSLVQWSCCVCDGLCVVFDGARQNIWRAQVDLIAIQCDLNPSEASFDLMTQRYLSRTRYR